MPTRTFTTKFRAEFEQHATLGRCPLRSEAPPVRAHAQG
jgi:hypothetical protein